MAEGALRLHEQGFKLAAIVAERGAGVVIEHPVNHGADSMWPIKGREEHSTLFETTLFKDFAKKVPGECVISDQCAAGAPTRKTTQWYCNGPMLGPMSKYLGVLHCPERETPDHPWPHSKSLVGKNDAGEWNSHGSDEYRSRGTTTLLILRPSTSPTRCGRVTFTTPTTLAASRRLPSRRPARRGPRRRKCSMPRTKRRFFSL